jgi:two-component system, cell cycle sensor histidine kinase and response regulator CckA
MDTNPLRGKTRGPLHIATIYLAVAVLWLLFSDRIVSSLVASPGLLHEIQTLKNWLFVIGTAWLIYVLLKREISTYQSVTEHLRKSRQELLDILDAMPVGIVLTDGVNVEYVNISFSDRFGYSLDEIPTDRQWFLLAYPDPVYREQLVASWKDELARARQSGASIRPFEVKVTCKSGKVRHAIANTQLINNRIVVILTDITERELMQNELVKMQKLESIGVLAGGIAHDFNNILTGIMGNLSFARLILEPGHAACQSLESAEKASERATELTRQLLTFAQGGSRSRKWFRFVR